MELSIPEGWTKDQTEAFLQFLTKDPKVAVSRGQPVARHRKPIHSCKDCGHQSDKDGRSYTGRLIKAPYCGLFSCTCITRVSNMEEPTWWTPKE